MQDAGVSHLGQRHLLRRLPGLRGCMSPSVQQCSGWRCGCAPASQRPGRKPAPGSGVLWGGRGGWMCALGNPIHMSRGSVRHVCSPSSPGHPGPIGRLRLPNGLLLPMHWKTFFNPVGKGTTCNSGPKPGVILEYPNRPIDKARLLSLAPVAFHSFGWSQPPSLASPLSPSPHTHSQRDHVIPLLGTTRWFPLLPQTYGSSANTLFHLRAFAHAIPTHLEPAFLGIDLRGCPLLSCSGNHPFIQLVSCSLLGTSPGDSALSELLLLELMV